MAPDGWPLLVNSRPFRITALALLVVFTFYLANPFGRAAFGRGTSTDATWHTGQGEPAEADQNAAAYNITGPSADHAGPRLRQASMIYSENDYNAVYERAVASHIRHGDQWGVPTHILRHDIIESGFFNKPAYLLGLVIDELSKPYGQRSEWIV